MAFTKDLLAHLKTAYCIDEGKVFATGMSNGGGFVNTLACLPEGSMFAAFAAVAGAFYGDVDGEEFECDPASSQIPMLEIHGDEDGIIPYAGGEASGVAIPEIPDWLHRWAARDGCSKHSTGEVRDLVNGHVEERRYSCNGSHGIVTGLKLKGMGHVWPSTTPNSDNGHVTTWIDAAPYILDFLDRSRKPHVMKS